MTRLRCLALLLACVVLLTGCEYEGPAGNFLSQRLTWLSYLDGEDIREACGPGAPDRYRLVYNADYDDQARGYDVIPLPGGGAVLRVQVDRGLVIDRVQLDEVLQLGVPDRSAVRLSPEEVAALEERLSESGAFAPPPVGLRLNARQFYWIVSGCRDGDFFLTGYRFPSDRFQQITFDDFLFRRDPSGVPIRRPTRSTYEREAFGCDSRARQEGRACFNVEIGENGLVGIATID
ncbi:MAG: hypothetical protein GVY13_09720 [Alphaproteobacteria bacterium]|jgi:hypothetical protein|nr:hypothetical protein [Alphaproteobacteria bacterium]